MEGLKEEQDQDVDMDAPQISTLHQEDSPPPPPRRVKLLVKDTRAAASQASSSRKRALSDDEEPEEEDEEDQLIDDDDVLPPIVVPPVVPSSSAADSSSKRKAPSKRKPRKSEKKIAEEERKSKEKLMQAGAPSLAPTMSWFEVQATKAHQHVGQMGTLDVGHVPPLNIVSLDPGPSSKPPPKKKAARKPPAVPRVRAKPGPKPKAVLLPVPPEDTDVISEAGYSVTAASSPVTAHFEGNTPEPEAFPPYANGPLVEEPPVNLLEVALPQYPLPVKPFSVQPPQKINTGFAPVLPIDRTAAKVRHWRPVNREIRGIAGGRWFTRSWVGEKESALALAIASGDKQSSVALPKLPTMSISAPIPSKPKVRATKNSSLAASAAPSRSSSTVPSKMRTIMLPPPSDGGDSDMVTAPGS
ncbi:hypothetical protein B0H17DRAFT_1070032 [Mycena rosella]|uniref:Uncharacterized protein n=1 Tax=Mycena rosella TaxID=1033263 RepID=A0AAD7DBG3_MYCRO|nr:hypothetical protein B0H17DRAFT_1070032 [Mycena rosella]